MPRFIVLRKLLVSSVVVIASIHPLFAKEAAKESARVPSEQKPKQSKSTEDDSQAAAVPDAGDTPVVTTHSIMIGEFRT